MDKDTAFEMYKVFRGERYESIQSHRENLQNYLAFSVAVLGATVAGSLQIRGVGLIGTIILAGPILNVFICLLAIRMCDRFYRSFLERVTILAKLESVLDIQDYKAINTDQDNATVFPGDKHLLPERWMQAEQYNTAEEFVQRMLNAGINQLAKLTFQLVIVVNVFLGVAILLAVFL